MMKYTICIHQAENGDHSGFVPDIAGCYFAGNSLEAAIADAYAAIDTHLVYQAKKGKAIPLAKDISEYINDDDCRNGYLTCIDIDIAKYTANAI
ncbi:type II toxin-antitoxin system HicB family antitoxin [Pectobacterium aroidearum]|nr:type II toxin-antitoxin system HicB family antitoxin [Pectobacterium aroidearum]